MADRKVSRADMLTIRRVFKADDPARLGLFGSRTLVLTRRLFEYVAGPHKGEKTEPETVYHASSALTRQAAASTESQTESP